MTIILKLLKEFALGKIFGAIEKFVVRKILNCFKHAKKTVLLLLGAAVVLCILYFKKRDRKPLGWVREQLKRHFCRKKANWIF